MKIEDCFLEAHYYSAGLRHRAYADSSRPVWAPEADTVGFRDEFEIANADSAVETRRFGIAGDQITWIGVYLRSVDAKLGDRGNHAGVGAWFRNAVPADVQQLLHGLALLARQISADIDPDKLAPNAARFLAPEFLPSYAIPIASLEPGGGFAFAAPGIVDSKIVTVRCDDGVSTCRPLTDYLVDLFWLEANSVPPRVLFHVSRDTRNAVDLAPDYEVAPKILRAISKAREGDRARIRETEAALDAVRENSKNLESQLKELQSETAELHALREDPMRLVTRRLDEIGTAVRALESKVSTVAVTQSATQWPPIRRSAVTPVRTGSTSLSEPEPPGFDWLFILLLVFGVAVIAAILFVIGDWVLTYVRT